MLLRTSTTKGSWSGRLMYPIFSWVAAFAAGFADFAGFAVAELSPTASRPTAMMSATSAWRRYMCKAVTSTSSARAKRVRIRFQSRPYIPTAGSCNPFQKGFDRSGARVYDPRRGFVRRTFRSPHRDERGRPRRRPGLLGAAPRRRGPVEDRPRPPLSRAARRLPRRQHRGGVRRPPGRHDPRAARVPRRREGAEPRGNRESREPPPVSARRRRTPLVGARGGARRPAPGGRRANRGRRRPEPGRPGGVPPYPRRNHARAAPASRMTGLRYERLHPREMA